MSLVVKNRIASFRHSLQKATRKGLTAAGAYMMREHTVALSVPNTGMSKTRKRNTAAGKKGSSYTIYPNSSKPGEYPRLRTGAGRSNVFMEDGGSEQQPYTRVGERENGIHIVLLELAAGRNGLLATLTTHRQRMGEIAVTVGRNEIKAA